MNHEFALNSYQSNFPERLSVVGKHDEKLMSACDLKIIAKTPSTFHLPDLGEIQFSLSCKSLCESCNPTFVRVPL